MSHDASNQQSRVMPFVARSASDLNIPALLAYSFKFDRETCSILLKAEVSRELTADELEQLSVAETELYADDILGRDTKIKTVVFVVKSPGAIQPLDDGVILFHERGSAPSKE